MVETSINKNESDGPALHPIQLRYTGEGADLEPAYAQYEYQNNLWHLRLAALFTIFLYGTFCLFDLVVSPLHATTFAIIRFAIVCPFFILLLGLTFRPYFQKIKNYLLVVAVLLTSCGYITMGLIAPIQVHIVYAVGVLVCLLFNYCFIRLPFLQALATGFFVCVAYSLVIIRWDALLGIEKTAYIMCVLCVQPILAAICYTSERANRKNYFLMNLLSRQKKEIEDANTNLEEALDQVKILSGLLPICSACKKIRDNKGNWSQIEHYISERSEAKFTHGICPKCVDKLYPDLGK